MVTNYGVNSATSSSSVAVNGNRVNPGNAPQIAPTNQIIPQGNPAGRQADMVQISPDARRAQGAQSSADSNATTRTTNRVTSRGTDNTPPPNRTRAADQVQISQEARRAQAQQQTQNTPPPSTSQNPNPTEPLGEMMS